MNGPVSLLKRDLSESTTIKKSNPYKVYIEDFDGTIYSTKLSSQIQTINDAILQALKNFNNNLGAGLPVNSELYQLYTAKRGKKDDGLPALDKDQKIEKVGKDKFFLVSINRGARLMSIHSLQSSKTIETDFDKKKQKGESQKQKGIFCFCGGW